MNNVKFDFSNFTALVTGGASGMGAYHGRAGFDAFSKLLPIVWQTRLAGSDLLKPPYSKVDRFIKLLLR